MVDQCLENSLRKCMRETNKSGNIFIDEYVIIPDAVSGVGEIVFVNLFPGTKQVDRDYDTVLIQGVLRYYIGYVADDPFSSLKVLSGEIDFHDEFDLLSEMNRDETFILAECRIDKIDYSIVNSKKISLNAVIKIKFDVLNSYRETYIENVDHQKEIEVLKADKMVYTLSEIRQEEFELHGKIQISYDQDEISQVALSQINRFHNHLVIKDERVLIEIGGELEAGYISNQGKFCLEKESFSEEYVMGFDGVLEDYKFQLKANLKDLEVNALEDADGEMRVLEYHAKFDVLVEIYKETNMEYLKDLYYLKSDAQIGVKEIDVIEDIVEYHKMINLQAFYEGMGHFKEVHTNGAFVDFSFAEKDDVWAIEGKVFIRGILIPKSEEDFMKGLEIDLPFTHEIQKNDFEKINSQDLTMHISVEEISVAFLEMDKTEFEVGLKVEIDGFETNKTIVVASIEEGELFESTDEQSSIVRLYYTSSKDTLWEICKKYKRKKEDILELNQDCNFEELEKGTMVLIP